jgi:flagellar biosynthesis protein FlhF
MHYITLEGERIDKLREKLLREYGEDIYIINVEEKKKGFLHNKRSYVMVAGIPDDVYLKRQKQQFLRTTTTAKEKSMENMIYNEEEENEEEETSKDNIEIKNIENKNKVKKNIDPIFEKLETIEKKLSDLNTNVYIKESILDRYISSLTNLDFSNDFLDEIKENLSKTLTYEEANSIEVIRKKTMEYLKGKIIIDNQRIGKNDIAVLIGPTGVGKTTTIVKLATNSKVNKNYSIKLLSADQTKIGGYAHLQIAAEILQVPFYTIMKRDDYISQIAEKDDVIFVDSPGTSQKDSKMLGCIKEILDVKKKNIKTFLTISATTKYNDLIDIFERFKFLDYTHLIITKIDETSNYGAILSAISRYNIPISYITNGQEMTKNLIEPDEDFILKLAFSDDLK